jgi:hypothetical protein
VIRFGVKLLFALTILSVSLFSFSPKAKAQAEAYACTYSNTSIPGQFSCDLVRYWVASLQLMTEQFHTVMMQQAQIIGSFLDAKHQLETQRIFQQKVAEAHKDYHPSESLCEVGTFARDLAYTERHGDIMKVAISDKVLERELSSGKSATVEGQSSDFAGRVRTLVENNCMVEDNRNGLNELCQGTGATEERKDRDVNYTALIDLPLTLDVDLTDDDVTEDENDLFSMVNYLFMHRPSPVIPRSLVTLKSTQKVLQDLRSVAAMRGVARNSIANIIGQKAAGPTVEDTATPFVRAMLVDFGLSEDEITEMIGEHPSYYAQMEILTKKLYQNPTFIAELYDKPANVKRMRAAMMAIKLMQDRDIHEALMRREMLLSMILEILVRRDQELAFDEIKDNL